MKIPLYISFEFIVVIKGNGVGERQREREISHGI